MNVDIIVCSLKLLHWAMMMIAVLVGTCALLCLKYGSRNFEIIQIIFLVWIHHLKIILQSLYAKVLQFIRYIAWILVYQMRPVIIFNFCLFLDRFFWYKSKQCRIFFNKQICGRISFCKPPYCSIWHLEAREYFGLCGNKAFSETMMWVNFFWTAPSLIIGELLLVVKDRALHATVDFRGLWLHIRKDAQVCDASAGVSLEEIQQRVFE